MRRFTPRHHNWTVHYANTRVSLRSIATSEIDGHRTKTNLILLVARITISFLAVLEVSRNASCESLEMIPISITADR